MDALKRIIKTRINFLLDHPFLGDLSLRLVVKKGGVPTMATDGKHLYFAGTFVNSLSQDQLKGVFAHEIGHIIFRHCGHEGIKRMAGRDPFVWNMACEYKVNHFAKDTCSLILPEGAAYDNKYDSDWTTEAVYGDLLRNKKGFSPSKGAEGFRIIDDHSRWGEQKTLEGGKNIDEDWTVWIAQALHSAKRQGNLPAGLERLVEDILAPVLPWQQILAEFVRGFARDDYSYRHPNRRHLHRGMFLPALRSEKINIGFALDTSGSMSEGELQEGLAECRGVMGAFPSYVLHVFGCDAAIHFYEAYGPMDEVYIKDLVKGGGGTDFRPVFNRIKDDDINLDALVYFTDAMGTFPDCPPGYPVLWAVKGNGDVPWGRRIEI